MAMAWTSMLAIYTLLWVLSAFLVMPFGLRTPDQVQGFEVGQGHANSAPVNFQPKRIMKRATVLAVVLFGLYYANYANQWIVADDLNFFGKPPVDNIGY